MLSQNCSLNCIDEPSEESYSPTLSYRLHTLELSIMLDSFSKVFSYNTRNELLQVPNSGKILLQFSVSDRVLSKDFRNLSFGG